MILEEDKEASREVGMEEIKADMEEIKADMVTESRV